MTSHGPPRPAPDDVRSRARADLVWYLRHADALARWPVIGEAWAQRLERRRLAGERRSRRGDREDGPPR